MPELYEDLTESERQAYITQQAKELVALAERMGMSLRILRNPLQPLAMGHAEQVVEVWTARQKPVQVTPRGGLDVPLQRPERREISDREWAAQPANMREGCTVRIPGVGEL